MAALGGVTVLNERIGILDWEAIRAAIGVLAGDDAGPFQRAMDTAGALGG